MVDKKTREHKEPMISCYLKLEFTLLVQVGDFGLSRLKHNTFLSSKSTAGTVRILQCFLLWFLCMDTINSNFNIILMHFKFLSHQVFFHVLAWVDGTWSSPQWALKWKVSCLLWLYWYFYCQLEVVDFLCSSCTIVLVVWLMLP